MLMNMNLGRKIKPKVNLILTSTDANGNVVGLIPDSRYNSGDTLISAVDYNACGFIPFEFGDVLHFENMDFGSYSNGACYLRWYISKTSSCFQDKSPSSFINSNRPSEETYRGVRFLFTYDANGNLATMSAEKTASYSQSDDIHFIRMGWRIRSGCSGKEIIWKE